MSACSPVLQAMITTDMVEASEQQVTLHNIQSGVMELLIEHMYKGETNIPPQLLLPTIEACDYLQLLELRECCLHQVPNAIKPENVISWHRLADSLNSNEVKTRCSELLSSSLANVSKGLEFLQLRFAEVSSCISGAQEIGADSDDLLEATINWITHKQKARQDHTQEMLEKTDLTRCSVECLDTVIDNQKELLTSQPDALRKLTKSVLQIARQPSGNIRKKRDEQGRKDANIIVISGHGRNATPHTECWQLDKSMKFVDLSNLAFSFAWHSVCQIPEGFVVSGGEENNLCAMFLLSTKSWKQLKALPDKRNRHASIFMKGKIFVFGGYVARSRSSSVSSLDLDGGEWDQEPGMPISVIWAEVTCVESSIFLFDSCASKQLLQLDMITKTWRTKAKPPCQEFNGARMISVKGQLLVCGGANKTFVHYNPSTDTWTTGNAPKLEHDMGALVHHDQKLYLIGGNLEDHVEEYDLGTDIWSICDVRVPKKLNNLHAFAM